jgi:hypothetical protein
MCNGLGIIHCSGEGPSNYAFFPVLLRTLKSQISGASRSATADVEQFGIFSRQTRGKHLVHTTSFYLKMCTIRNVHCHTTTEYDIVSWEFDGPIGAAQRPRGHRGDPN